jgi:coenzyme PQQ synthesis protein D (PqqD)
VATAVPGETLDPHVLSDRFRSFPHVVWARQADATVLLDVERGMYYTLNEVAGRIWELLVANEPVIEILRCLGDEFDVPAETLEADTAALIGRLLDAGLIERIAP